MAAESGWIIEQVSPNTGDCAIYVTQNAVKVVSHRFGFELVCKAPDWRVYGFRKQEKVIWTNSLTQFDGGMLVQPLTGAQVNDDKVEPKAIEMKNGVRCRLYIVVPGKSEKIWAAEDIKVAKQGAVFLQQFYSSPNTGKVPIFRTRFMAGKKPLKNRWMTDYSNTGGPGWHDYVTTTSCKKAVLSAKDFDVPTGYKRTKFLTEVAFSKGKMSDLTDALDSLGFREDKKSK